MSKILVMIGSKTIKNNGWIMFLLVFKTNTLHVLYVFEDRYMRSENIKLR